MKTSVLAPLRRLRTSYVARRLAFFSTTASNEGSGVVSPERVVGDSTRHTFQAETKQLLNIVTNSLYTDKHVFIRLVVKSSSLFLF